MRLRKGKNCLGPSGFVKKSAMLSALATKGTTICKFSTHSRTKKWRRATCFNLHAGVVLRVVRNGDGRL
eukprot:3082776-Prymnesium_polylepis.1